MFVRSALSGLVLLVGCSAKQGPLLHARDAETAAVDQGDAVTTNNDARPPTASTGTLRQDVAWQYQLTGTVDPTSDAQLYVIDLFDVDASLIDTLHAGDKIVLAYLSAGTFEPFRSDVDAIDAGAVGNPLAAYPEESWLDVRDATVRSVMADRLDRARMKGFDGVLPTNMSAYRSDSGFPLDADDQAGYSMWLAEEARQRGLLVGMSGDYAQVAALEPYFDFGVHFGCIARDDCDVLDAFAVGAKPRFDIETEGNATQVCARGAEYGINVLIKRPSFDAFRETCPP